MAESTTTGPRPTSPGAATENATIRPFRVEVPEEDLVELRRRIDATRWPEKETVGDDSQGVPLATMQALARYWATESAYPNLVYCNQHDRGGHFAAWEQPQLLSGDVRATFRSLR